MHNAVLSSLRKRLDRSSNRSGRPLRIRIVLNRLPRGGYPGARESPYRLVDLRFVIADASTFLARHSYPIPDEERLRAATLNQIPCSKSAPEARFNYAPGAVSRGRPSLTIPNTPLTFSSREKSLLSCLLPVVYTVRVTEQVLSESFSSDVSE